MHILIVAATQQEIEPLFSSGGQQLEAIDLQSAVNNRQSDPAVNERPGGNCELLVTGAGMVATAFALGRHLARHQYDLAINLGVAGSFDSSLSLGEVVEITTDMLPELGAEDDEDFLPMEQLGLGDSIFSASASLSNIFAQYGIIAGDLLLKQVTGVTVNTVHGNELTIRKIVKRHNPQLESMEGAAFFYACRKAGLPCLQIRAVSNYVERRNRDNWEIALAIKNLNIFAAKLLDKFAK